MRSRGRVWKFGDFLDAEEICATQYFPLAPLELRKHVFEILRPEFGEKVAPGDLIVGGRGFGAGAGHDHCNVALKSTGVAGVIAVSFGTQFYRHSVDHAMPLIRAEDAFTAIADGDDVEVDFLSGEIVNHSSGTTILGGPLEGTQLEIVMAGGLIPYLRERMGQEQSE